MFERFTPSARRVLVLAQDQARSVGHGFIDTEHLLLGLLGEDQGTASQALGAAGVDAGAVRAAMAATMGPVSTDTQGPLAAGNAGSAPASVGFSPLARQALELSLR
ncbi:MAG TPA: Clp protease N-terminal domain-containing protein, partial [Acidimicrobiales bacterium]|nr:Clp protease N-terminal domain-containing protein [Acidimicrobiales bacterium]